MADAKTLLYPTDTFEIRGACFEVYRNRGCGFSEAVYQECLAIEFGLRDIPFVQQPLLTLEYSGHALQASYRPDFVCFERIVLEIKALGKLTGEHHAQVHNYLKATGLRLALLANFGHYPGMQIERIVR